MNWDQHFYRLATESRTFASAPEEKDALQAAKQIEPWLSTLLQAEHFSLLLGSGFTISVAAKAKAAGTAMDKTALGLPADLEGKLANRAASVASAIGRSEANVEDQIRALSELSVGLEILEDSRKDSVDKALNSVLRGLIESLLATERALATDFEKKESDARDILGAFLLSFISRSAARERLHIFTSNYDRLIELGCDLLGVRIMDRFVGTMVPIFRASRLDVDIHYNPPGIRGEPRFLEGVARLTKLHGSLDWRFTPLGVVRADLPFAAEKAHPALPSEPRDHVVVYPNATKDSETANFPYAEMFRDFASAICRPNSVLLTFGFGFGDDHYNRVIADMLSIPSTHLVVIAYGDKSKKIQEFVSKLKNSTQISLLFGSHFGDIGSLVKHYLPRPSVDELLIRQADLQRRRGSDPKAP